MYFDELSESLSNELRNKNSPLSKLMINIDRFDIGQSYITAKIYNKQGDLVNLNIQGGKSGIDLQETLFTVKGKLPSFVYIKAVIKNSNKTLIRKLPVLGIKDWLLIYDDAFFLQGVKDLYDEIEFFAY